VTLTVGSLFAGIGGFDLAAEWMGWRTIWVSEIDPYASAVLAHRFPEAPNLGDITKIEWERVEAPAVLCGGFPCQDISNAGKRAGIDGERSGLWREYARAIRDLRPRYVIIENVAALLGRGAGRVLGDLAALGYDAEWDVVSAEAVGAPHLRERLWILAYPDTEHGERWAEPRQSVSGERPAWIESQGRGVDDSDSRGRCEPHLQREQPGRTQTFGAGETASEDWNTTHDTTHSAGVRRGQPIGNWRTEPNVGRVADGVPDRVDRLRGLGNAIVPQCAVEGPFRRIQELETLRCSAGRSAQPHD
jgi:DNA (cytosine-5)-methyltransferase 1